MYGQVYKSVDEASRGGYRVNMNDQLLLLKKFPLIVPQNGEFTLYRGFIQVGVSVVCENILPSLRSLRSVLRRIRSHTRSQLIVIN
jgi:hypothetical protein